MIMKKSKKTALSGIFCALSVVCLAIGAIIQTLDLSAAVLGSLIILIAFIELGKRRALGIYAAASILSLVLLPHKVPAAVFGLFAGHYPILKERLNRITPKWLSFTARLACFNVALALLSAFAYFFAKADFAQEFPEGFLWISIVVMYLMCNLIFLIYDLLLERISVFYCVKIRPKVFGK